MIKKTVFRGKQYLGVVLDSDQMKRDFICLANCKMSKKVQKLLDIILNNLAMAPIQLKSGKIVITDDDTYSDAAQDIEFTFGNYKKGKSQ